MTTFHAVDQAIEAGSVVAVLHPLGESAIAGNRLAIIRDERAGDFAAREALLERALGPDRMLKSSELLRAGRLPADGLALVALVDGEMAGSVRLWHARAGDCDALLLGPLAVDAQYRSFGIGAALMREAIARAGSFGHAAILLVGDEAYYQRFGFSAALTSGLDMPGPVDRDRFLALELEPGAIRGQAGVLLATGDFSKGDFCKGDFCKGDFAKSDAAFAA
ncbi:MAG: N-acetyltransferase [Beijerinckiaceae bacterium]|jgi:predicted N-acetyltransferase YhbS|nr:N-acetyltransferase [Beijerinckiaceae bacterium]